MPSAPAPTFKSAAHRRVVMQRLASSIVPTAIAFAIAGPLVGMLLIWGSTLVAMICSLVTTGGENAWPMLYAVGEAIISAYVCAAFPAAIAGVWVALLSPFVPENQRVYAGAALLGAATTFLFLSATPPTPGILGGPLFLSIVGAVSAFICTWMFRDFPLARREADRDRLARDRAERLAKARATA